MPRGVTVAGVEVGGLSRAEAEAKLRDQLDGRLKQPMQLKVADVTTPVDPAKAGLVPDWTKTLDHAGAQPVNPITNVAADIMLDDLAWWSSALEKARAGGELVPGNFRLRAALTPQS